MRRPASTRSAAEPVETRITRVGAEGDGIGRLPDGKPVYVPLTLPGELVRARPAARRGEGWAATLEAVLEPAAARVAPPCPHFGVCGGCVLQHWDANSYCNWKTDLLREALRRAGFAEEALPPLACTAPRQRRRMDLAVARQGQALVIGLHARGGPVVELQDCLVLDPALFALAASLRPVLRRLRGIRRQASIAANRLDAGIDVLLRTDSALNLQDRSALIGWAHDAQVLRLSWALDETEPEPLALLRPPVITLSGVPVTPPPGAFLQASPAGEAAILAAVLAGLPDRLGKRSRIADLYAGCGTISFALAQHARVAAFEGERGAAGALRAAANAAGLAGRVEVAHRDLARQPLIASELAGFAAVVLDPPFAGAAAQMPFLAAARPDRVIYVSCNPAALGRDASVLRAAGYRLIGASPIDQFLWSARLESVCVFAR